MQFSLKIFEDKNHDRLRVMEIDGEPWFVLSDVCRALELAPRNGYYGRHAEKLEDDQKRLVAKSSLNGTPPVEGEGSNGVQITVISESGLYTLILRSDKPSAKRFRRWVTGQVLPSIRRSGGYSIGRVPAFIARYSENWDRVSAGHFSIMNELVVHLWGRLEHAGHIMADRSPKGVENRPDTSVGRCFSSWLKIHHPEVCDSYTYYTHKTPEWESDVRQYPFAMLPLFREYLDDVWIPERAEGYLKTRDVAALPYLPKLLPSTVKPKLIPSVRSFRKAS